MSLRNLKHISHSSSAADREAERQTRDVVPSVPGGGQRSAWRRLLHGLPVPRSQRNQAAAHLTCSVGFRTFLRIHAKFLRDLNKNLTADSLQEVLLRGWVVIHAG